MIHPKLSDVDPYLLTRIGASGYEAYRAALAMGKDAAPRLNHDKKPDATPCASRYKGVRLNKGKWVGAWGGRMGRAKARTDDGERQAALDRARALGLDYLELRDGTREAV